MTFYINRFADSSSRLIDNSAHIGQKQYPTQLRNFLLGTRNGLAFYNPSEIQSAILKASHFLNALLKAHGNVWWVSTLPEHARIIEYAAHVTNQTAITHKWTSGGLTNQTRPRLRNVNIPSNLKTRHAQLLVQQEKKTRTQCAHLGSTHFKRELPDLLVVLDATSHSQIISESNLLRRPVISIVDTRVTPQLLNQITYPIPGASLSLTFVYYVIQRLLVTTSTRSGSLTGYAVLK